MKKVLIIAGALHIGGAERVAANLSKYAPEGDFAFDYLVFDGFENAYGPEIEERGGRVISMPSPGSGYVRYCRDLEDLIKKNRYSVVHSHTQFNSGINLAIAKKCGVPIRIAHSHTTKTERRVSLPQKAYEGVMRILLRRTATHFVACGEEAGVWMFGERAFSKRGQVIKNGIDVTEYSYSEENRSRIRKELGLSEQTFVIGHAGTLLPLKNQEFLIRLLPKIRERRHDSILLLLGAGTEEEKAKLQNAARSCGVGSSVIFAGGVSNVNEYLSAMDVFAFPSLREGTPLALLEAQANGLPCIISDRIPKDAVLTDLVQAFSPDEGALWIDPVCEAKRIRPGDYGGIMTDLGYDSVRAYDPVYDIYRSTATASLSFDDGRGDNYGIINELLIPRGVPATLNITTGYVDGTCPEENAPSKKPPVSVSEVRLLHKNPLVEIAMHGDRHINTEEDVLLCRDKLVNWLGLHEGEGLGFASPGSGLSLDLFRSQAGEGLRRSMAYMRTGLRIGSMPKIRALARKAARVLHLPCLFRIAYHDTVMTEADGQILYSIPVMRDTSVKEVMAAVKEAIRRRGAVILMLHSIEEDVSNEDNWAWKKSKLGELCDELKRLEHEGKLSLLTTIDQYRLLLRRK